MGDSYRPDWSGRLTRLTSDSISRGLRSFVISYPTNITYACGLRASAGLLVLSAEAPRLVVDGRYVATAREGVARGELAAVRVHPVARRYDVTLAEVLAEVLAEGGSGPVGVEAEHVSLATLMDWQKAAPEVTFEPVRGVVEARRAVKDSGEIEVLRRAGRRISDVARQIGGWVAEGRTEREVAGSVEEGLERAGFSGPAFPTIVASGPNSAHPHARPTDRRLRPGDLVLLDFGGVLDGYCADLTRMAGIGHVGTQARAVFDAVRAAHEAALAEVRGGVEASMVDAAARRVLSDLGLGEAFLHATGHGLGLEVHEAPRIARAEENREERLEPGMVCTIEPGAYLDGIGGVRLEDDVLVTAEGCEVLTDAPRDLLVI